MIALLLASWSQDFGRIQTLELEAGQRADVATLADLDGDGVREVLLALHEPGKKFARRLETWRAGQGGKEGGEPARSESLALTPDVVAFAHADVREGGGEELLLFNAGGSNTVRGYPEDSLSAINIADFALGGTDLLVLNTEVRFPITKRFGAAAFLDAGNTFASIRDLTLGSLALGVGAGVRVRTPLAPLRLDVAHPFSNEYGRRGLRVHFSIGQMF